MRISDMHFHLDGYPNHRQIYNQINDLEQYTLCVTNSPDIFEACLSTYKETTFVRFGLGIHPLQKQSVGDVEKFKRLIMKTKYIGEVGLDFSKASILERQKQIECFSTILNYAGKDSKIFSIHSTKAENEVYKLIEPYAKTNRFIMHWFCGDEQTLEKLIGIGSFFSLNISQIRNQLEIIKKIPKNKILVESDAPKGSYISGRFTPQKLIIVYDKLSEALGFDVSEQVQNNLRDLLK